MNSEPETNPGFPHEEVIEDLPQPIPKWVKGWMYPFELRWLYNEAVRLKGNLVPGELLEIGSFRGLSACALGQAARLTCIDTFLGGEDMGAYDSWDDFWKAMAALQLRPTVLRGTSREMLPTLKGRQFALILVDGSHTYDNVLYDLTASWNLLSKGGALVTDDVDFTHPDVMRAVRDSHLPFKPIDLRQSKMAVVYK